MADALAADTRLGNRYRLLRRLARGGMATVWEAEDEVLSRRVAVKVLHPHLAEDDGFRERFRREAVAVARLSHPAIVAVYDTGSDDDLVWLVMELVEGRTLRDVLVERGALPVAEAVDLVAQIADGLTRAHERGIVHRDVKPGNVLVTPDGRAKITDFGIARGTRGDDLDADLTSTGTIVGTAKYVAPEQVSSGAVDARTDVYALGLVLYEAICGRPAFDGDSDLATALARTQGPPLSPRQVRVDVPRGLETVIMKAVALDPDDRHPSAGDLRSALYALDVGHDEPTPEAGIAVRPPDDRRFTVGVAGLVVVGVLIAVAGALLAGTETGRSVIESVRDRLPGGDGPSQPIAIAAAADVDPFGDDRAENPETAPLAVDGDAQTAWRTDVYHTPAFGNLKSGVGLRIDLADAASLDRLEVDTLGEGWSAAVYVGDGSADAPEGWGQPIATGEGLGRTARFDLTGAGGRSVLLWITHLPASGQLEVAEVRVRG